MNKEQLAEEYATYHWGEKNDKGFDQVKWGFCKETFIAGYEEAEPKWISVNEQLPYSDGKSQIPCLVVTKYGDTVVRQYNEYHKVWDDEYGDETYCDAVGSYVICWMPLDVLPSPPKTE